MAIPKLSAQFKKGFQKVQDRLQAAYKEAASPAVQMPIAEFALSLIVKRTRLGYGVRNNFGEKERLPQHSKRYIQVRKDSPHLSETTSPTKSNLTFTGELLESVRVIKARDGKIVISPDGVRSDGRLTNLKLARILESKNRVFNRISELEYQQILRFYRKTFGDLLSKRKLLR